MVGDYRYHAREPNRFSWGVGLTQLMFTPDNPTALSAPKGERPYTGSLGIEFSLHVKNSESASSVTIALGTTGPNRYADDSQTWIHENVSSSPTYQDWDSQVPVEMTVNLHLDHKHRIDRLDCGNDSTFEIDGYYEWGAALGNFRTDADLGGLLRAGYNLPDNDSTPRVQIGSYEQGLFKEETRKDAFSVFGFTGIRGSAVLHDITLDGPIFRDFDTVVDSKPFVGELLIGAGIRWGDCDLSLSRTLRTDEFAEQNENQQFGSVLFRLQWPW
ncbi:MAG: lipid A deacylase LpxR family protein [Lentimonas sp.]